MWYRLRKRNSLESKMSQQEFSEKRSLDSFWESAVVRKFSWRAPLDVIGVEDDLNILIKSNLGIDG